MKLHILVLVILLAIGCLGINIKKKDQAPLHEKVAAKSMLAKMQRKMQTKTQGINLAGYPQEILKELNIYRRKEHYFPMIQWLNPLAATASQEAQHIVSKKSFGEHANFGTWKQQNPNRFFTELALDVDTEGMSPPKRIFAKTVIEALKQEQEWYLIHPYTHAGIAVIPGQGNHYIIVIHLSRSAPIKEFHSCQEAQKSGLANPQIEIINKGKKYKVTCDQKTAGGGWTLVLEIGKLATDVVITPINDMDMSYTQLLFKAKDNYLMDYYKGHPNVWDFNGFCFPLNGLKFDNLWYISKENPTHAAEKNTIQKTTYDVNANYITVLQKATKCYFGNANKPEFCAKEFILNKLPKGRLNAISDVESITKKWTGDNLWQQYFQIYLR